MTFMINKILCIFLPYKLLKLTIKASLIVSFTPLHTASLAQIKIYSPNSSLVIRNHVMSSQLSSDVKDPPGCTQSLPLLCCRWPWCQLLCWVCWLSSAAGSRYRPDRSLLLQGPHQIRSPKYQIQFLKYKIHSLILDSKYQIPNGRGLGGHRRRLPDRSPLLQGGLLLCSESREGTTIRKIKHSTGPFFGFSLSLYLTFTYLFTQCSTIFAAGRDLALLWV